MSSAVAPISIAKTDSDMSSPACGPTIPTPTNLPVPLWAMIFVRPSVLLSVRALPEAAQGNFDTSISTPASPASLSVIPHQAISGSVNMTAGTARGSSRHPCRAKTVLNPVVAATAFVSLHVRFVKVGHVTVRVNTLVKRYHLLSSPAAKPDCVKLFPDACPKALVCLRLYNGLCNDAMSSPLSSTFYQSLN